MSEKSLKSIELVGAVRNAVAEAAIYDEIVSRFEVFEISHIENGKIAHWQVTVKIGATMDE